MQCAPLSSDRNDPSIEQRCICPSEAAVPYHVSLSCLLQLLVSDPIFILYLAAIVLQQFYNQHLSS